MSSMRLISAVVFLFSTTGFAGSKIKQVVGGVNHTCVLFEDGKAKCWGGNTYGEAGLEFARNVGRSPNQMGDNLPYVNVGTNLTITKMTAGSNHTCALLNTGDIKCWGYNAYGQLGIGHTKTRGDITEEMGDYLKKVDLGKDQTAIDLAAGYYHNCAILKSGDVKCWGANFNGELGLAEGNLMNRGDRPNQLGDALPKVNLGAGRTAKTIAAGNSNTCVVLDNDALKCWGYNGAGNLGIENAVDHGAAANSMGDNLPAVNLGTGFKIAMITVGELGACALSDQGRVKCWGSGEFGQLGQGETTEMGSSEGSMGDYLPFVDLGDVKITKISSSFGAHCALTSQGGVKCWGINFVGGLGLGDLMSRGDMPGQMGEDLPYVDMGTFETAVDLGMMSGYHNCAIIGPERLKCWGYNSGGQLGQGVNAPNLGSNPNDLPTMPSIKLFGPY